MNTNILVKYIVIIYILIIMKFMFTHYNNILRNVMLTYQLL